MSGSDTKVYRNYQSKAMDQDFSGQVIGQCSLLAKSLMTVSCLLIGNFQGRGINISDMFFFYIKHLRITNCYNYFVTLNLFKIKVIILLFFLFYSILKQFLTSF